MVPPSATSARIRIGVSGRTAFVDSFEGGDGVAEVVTVRSGGAGHRKRCWASSGSLRWHGNSGWRWRNPGRGGSTTSCTISTPA
jgi:hypothetical protein